MAVIKKGSSWFVDYRDANKNRKLIKAGNTKNIALELDRKILAERDLKKRFGYKEIEQITVPALIEKYKEYSIVNKRAGTCEMESYALKKIEQFFQDKFVLELTCADLENYKIFRAKDLKNASVNRELCVLKNMLQKAKDWEFIVEVPSVKNLKNPPARIRYLSKEETKCLLKTFKSEHKKHQLRCSDLFFIGMIAKREITGRVGHGKFFL